MRDKQLIEDIQSTITAMEQCNVNISETLPYCSEEGKKLGELSLELNRRQIAAFKGKLSVLQTEVADTGNKTAIMMAIEQIDKDIAEYEHNDDGLLALKNMRVTLQSLLPIERAQIENSYNDGWADGTNQTGASGADYFTSTYKHNG